MVWKYWTLVAKRLKNMTPTLASLDAADSGLTNAVVGADVHLSIPASQSLADCQHIGFVDFGATAVGAAKATENPAGMEGVAAPRGVLKVLQSRVALVAVQMVDFASGRTGADECLANQVVNSRVPSFVASNERDAPIAADPMLRTLQNFTRTRPRRPRRSLDSAHGTDGVVQLKTCDWGPEFAGQVGVHGVQRFTRHSSFPPGSIMARSEA